MDQKETYRKLCLEKPEIGLFQSADWLHAVADENWDVALAIKGKELLGAMPYFHKKKMGFKIITMPPLTPHLGPILFYPSEQKAPARLAFEKEILGLLINGLPKTDKFIQYFDPSFTNGLPFQWEGFEQSVRYTYMITKTMEETACWDGLQGNIRRAIKKAQGAFAVESSQDSSELFKLKAEDYQEKKLELDFDADYLAKITTTLLERDTGKLLVSRNDKGLAVASVLLGWDATRIHYIAGALDPNFRSSGALSQLLWEGIKLASEKGLQFNFEGGMFESIEKYFRGFGAEPQPYFQMSKIDSKVLNLF